MRLKVGRNFLDHPVLSSDSSPVKLFNSDINKIHIYNITKKNKRDK